MELLSIIDLKTNERPTCGLCHVSTNTCTLSLPLKISWLVRQYSVVWGELAREQTLHGDVVKDLGTNANKSCLYLVHFCSAFAVHSATKQFLSLRSYVMYEWINTLCLRNQPLCAFPLSPVVYSPCRDDPEKYILQLPPAIVNILISLWKCISKMPLPLISIQRTLNWLY